MLHFWPIYILAIILGSLCGLFGSSFVIFKDRRDDCIRLLTALDEHADDVDQFKS